MLDSLFSIQEVKKPQDDRRAAPINNPMARAIEHRMTIVTRNVADFSQSGVKVFDSWQ
jgi:hypothetical protein